jgi:hypothetical protein
MIANQIEITFRRGNRLLLEVEASCDFKLRGLSDTHESLQRVAVVFPVDNLRRNLTTLLDEILQISKSSDLFLLEIPTYTFDSSTRLEIKSYLGRAIGVSCLLVDSSLEEKQNCVVTKFEIRSKSQCLGSIDGWTIGILSNGVDEEAAIECARSAVLSLTGRNFELIVVGPVKSDYWPLLNSLVLETSQQDRFAPIAEKKNLIIQHAKFENILILHSRYRITKEFFSVIATRGCRWDLLTFRQLTIEERIFPHLLCNSGGKYLSLENEVHLIDNLYVNGGAFALKKTLGIKFPLNSLLFWNEGEDVEWSKRIISAGVTPRFEKGAIAYTVGALNSDYSKVSAMHFRNRFEEIVHKAEINKYRNPVRSSKGVFSTNMVYATSVLSNYFRGLSFSFEELNTLKKLLRLIILIYLKSLRDVRLISKFIIPSRQIAKKI